MKVGLCDEVNSREGGLLLRKKKLLIEIYGAMAVLALGSSHCFAAVALHRSCPPVKPWCSLISAGLFFILLLFISFSTHCCPSNKAVKKLQVQVCSGIRNSSTDPWLCISQCICAESKSEELVKHGWGDVVNMFYHELSSAHIMILILSDRKSVV